MKRNEFTWKGFRIPAEGQLGDLEDVPQRRTIFGLKRVKAPSVQELAEERQAVACIADLLRAAHDELVDCRKRGDARAHDGTDAIHSDGEPPIAYVIDRIERMLGDGR